MKSDRLKAREKFKEATKAQMSGYRLSTVFGVGSILVILFFMALAIAL
jgi:hypothetical protein